MVKSTNILFVYIFIIFIFILNNYTTIYDIIWFPGGNKMINQV